MFKFGNSKGLSVLKDPFKMANIEHIRLDYKKIMFEKVFAWTATVYFQNGNTSGQQAFEVRDDESETGFEDITKEIQAFINNL